MEEKEERKRPHGAPPPQDLSPALPVSGPTDLAWASWGTESKLRTAGWAPTSAPPPEPSEKEVGGTLNYIHETFSNSSVLPDLEQRCLPGDGSLAWVRQALGASVGQERQRGSWPGLRAPPLSPLPAAASPPRLCAEFTHCCSAVLVSLIWWQPGGGADPTPPDPAAPALRYLGPRSFLPPLTASDLSTSLPSILWALLCLQLSFLLPPRPSSLPRALGVGGCPKAELTPPPTHQLEHVLPRVEA